MPSAFVFYHYLYPDGVVSSIHLSELCSGLVERGWTVTAFPCNRGCRDETIKYPPNAQWKGVTIRRLWRLPLRQASGLGRVLNACWMLTRWATLALGKHNAPDVLIVGTDPIFSVWIAPFWKLFKRKTKIVHWCFDLYPEAIFADGMLRETSSAGKFLAWAMRKSYAACDAVVDIGPCMRERMSRYQADTHTETLVPWALVEPNEPLEIIENERQKIFGDARYALMYSGNFGRAHSYTELLELVRLMRDDGVQLALSVRGNRVAELQKAVGNEDTNVHFLPFVPPEQLEERLRSADIHVVSLQQEWTGTVVPSKFFGALAIGRPVLFCGSDQSAVAKWIRRFEIGWVLSPGKANETAADLRGFLESPTAMKSMRDRCHRVYQEHFSKLSVQNQWHKLLSSLVVGSAEDLVTVSDSDQIMANLS